MRRFSIFLLFFIALPVLAQQPLPDHMLRRIQTGKFREGKYVLMRDISDSLAQKQQYALAYKLFERLRTQYEDQPDDSITPDVYALTGDFYNATANYNQALEILERAANLYERQHRPKGMCNVFTNMGICYFQLGNNDKALEYYKKVLTLNEKYLHDELIASNIYNNIGILYCMRRNYMMGRNFFERALEVYRKQADSASVGHAYNNFATIFEQEDKNDSAYFYFQKALALKEKFGDLNDKVDAHNNFANLLLKLGRVPEALKYVMMNLNLLDTSAFTPDLQQTYNLLHKIYERMHNVPFAYRYYKLSRTIDDTIRERNKTSELLQREINVEVGKMHLSDSLAAAEETRVRQLELQQKKRQNTFLFASLIAAALIALLLYNRFRVTRRQKHVIAEQKHLVELKQKEMLDSIHYARRIQRSLLTSEKYIERTLAKLRRNK